jgi:hypothetical protein
MNGKYALLKASSNTLSKLPTGWWLWTTKINFFIPAPSSKKFLILGAIN